MEDPVSALRPRQPVTVPAESPRSGTAIGTMLTHNLGALLVDGRGAASSSASSASATCSRRWRASPTPTRSWPVERRHDAQPRNVVTTDTLAFALHKMDIGGYRHLPVLKDGQPVGVVSVRDMLPTSPASARTALTALPLAAYAVPPADSRCPPAKPPVIVAPGNPRPWVLRRLARPPRRWSARWPAFAAGCSCKTCWRCWCGRGSVRWPWAWRGSAALRVSLRPAVVPLGGAGGAAGVATLGAVALAVWRMPSPGSSPPCPWTSVSA